MKYRMMKATTILLGTVTIPLAYFAGFSFGEGRYSVGWACLAVQTFLYIIDSIIWFWVMEHMNGKGLATGATRNHQES